MKVLDLFSSCTFLFFFCLSILDFYLITCCFQFHDARWYTAVGQLLEDIGNFQDFDMRHIVPESEVFVWFILLRCFIIFVVWIFYVCVFVMYLFSLCIYAYIYASRLEYPLNTIEKSEIFFFVNKLFDGCPNCIKTISIIIFCYTRGKKI